MRKKTDLAIVNRSFWPRSQVIGESLLQFAERLSGKQTVCVITQADESLEKLLRDKRRGKDVEVRACKSYTTSASGVMKRIAEAIFFMTWTFYSLVRARPATVYVSTNPPVVVPFIVAMYCRLFNAGYVYHLQDIHPEAANIVVPLNRLVFRLLKIVDNYTLRHAKAIITLSEDMKAYVEERSGTDVPIHLLDNPSFDINPTSRSMRTKDIVFCGNAGRLQRIPLILAAIRDYLEKGGTMCFTFAGRGVHSKDIAALASDWQQVEYLGFIPATDAAQLLNEHRWALLPIDDEVTRYAFPSKSSGYALSGAGTLAVCGMNTSVARWVKEHRLGIVCAPESESLVRCFFEIEKNSFDQFQVPEGLRKKLQISFFTEQLVNIVTDGFLPAVEGSNSTEGIGS